MRMSYYLPSLNSRSTFRFTDEDVLIPSFFGYHLGLYIRFSRCLLCFASFVVHSSHSLLRYLSVRDIPSRHSLFCLHSRLVSELPTDYKDIVLYSLYPALVACIRIVIAVFLLCVANLRMMINTLCHVDLLPLGRYRIVVLAGF